MSEKNNKPTERQIGYARKLGIKNPEQYTREELSNEIDRVKKSILNSIENDELSSNSIRTSDMIENKQSQQRKIFVGNTTPINKYENKIHNTLVEYVTQLNKVRLLEQYVAVLMPAVSIEDNREILERISDTVSRLEHEQITLSRLYVEVLEHYFDNNYKKVVEYIMNMNQQQNFNVELEEGEIIDEV